MIDDLVRRATTAAAARPRPEATYRLQFHAGFTFRDAAALAPYLRDLGVTHVYSSPYMRARQGSTHGYDIVDHRALNPEIGSPEDYEAFVAALHEHGLRQILDIVPNHMGVATNDNPWWTDVLENGPASRFAEHFDIAWLAPARPEHQNRVLLPVLGATYGETLEAGQLRVLFDGGAFWVGYHDRRFPLAPRSYAAILDFDLDALKEQLGPEHAAVLEYQSILTAIGHLPDRTETDPAKVAERQREKEIVKRRLADLTANTPEVLAFVERNVAAINGDPADPRSFDRLDELLQRQCYRLAFWQVASDEINYRRFFDINDLAALSIERPEVFDAAHDLVFRLLTEGKIDGVRIDHPDGLFDPKQYFRRLQKSYLCHLARQGFDGDWKAVADEVGQGIDAVLDGGGKPLYAVAEKILGATEPLPDDWPVHGTSGYEFLNVVNGLFVDRTAEAAFSQLYREWTDESVRFKEMVYRCKRLILQTALASELHTLARQLDRLAQKGRRSRDFTLNSLRDALREVIASFPVYRSYIADAVHDTDRAMIGLAVRRATTRNPLTGRPLFDFIRRMLLLEYPDGATDDDKAEQRRFVGKFQQVTSPVMAKGLEDTLFYRFNRLVSLNEVGGDPGRFGTSVEAFHRFNADRAAKWPHALSPLSTHDTKRSEDVRARLNVLTELPDEWGRAVRQWAALNARHKQTFEDGPAPDPNEEYLLYQTLVGAWPLEPCSDSEYAAFVARIQAYAFKALHEAKVRSSWVNPNTEYDAAVKEFIAKVLDRDGNAEFLAEFRPFQEKVARFGLVNSLAQTLLKLTAPGAPDTYQGTELWDFSLVDPDNRRPVDYDCRRKLLAEVQAANARDLTGNMADGRIKLFVTHRALVARRDNPGLFSEGEYQPLVAEGSAADHVVAFARVRGGRAAVVVVPRLTARLDEGWGDTRLSVPPGNWRCAFTGATRAFTDNVPVAEPFADFPVVLWLRDP